MADENDDGLGSVSGLPDELGIDEDLARSEQRANVRVESRRYDKPMTIIEGLDSDSVDLDDLASELKSALAVGGTVDEGRIELQGDHAGRAPDLLRKQGFEVE
jgi:translation initiation factor 1